MSKITDWKKKKDRLMANVKGGIGVGTVSFAGVAVGKGVADSPGRPHGGYGPSSDVVRDSTIGGLQLANLGQTTKSGLDISKMLGKKGTKTDKTVSRILNKR